jgi:hypothetical protein
MAFVGGRKAQGRDSHALVLEVEQTRGEARKLMEQWWLGARWTRNASRLLSNKEFSSQLQETKVFCDSALSLITEKRGTPFPLPLTGNLQVSCAVSRFQSHVPRLELVDSNPSHYIPTLECKNRQPFG